MIDKGRYASIHFVILMIPKYIFVHYLHDFQEKMWFESF